VVNDIHEWLKSSTAKAKYFLYDLTRKPMPDLIAVTEQDEDFVKGVIIESLRSADVGALWWTTADDVQSGLELGYFDVTRTSPVVF
jgi:hypothetical protein